jgi:hypothetical protein
MIDVSNDAWTWRQYLSSPVSSTLQYVLDKLLERSTSLRYQSVAAILKDLQSKTVKKTTQLSLKG